MLDLTSISESDFNLEEISGADSSQTSQIMVDEQHKKVASMTSMPSFSSGSLKKNRKSNPQSTSTLSKFFLSMVSFCKVFYLLIFFI